MTNNSLSIHIESGDTFYQNFNTVENVLKFYTCSTGYQSKFHTITVLKKTQNFLPSFSIDDVEKFDLYANKNAKYLFDRSNYYIKRSGGKRQTIKHTLKIKDSIGLKKFEERDCQLLIEKIIHSVEFKNPYENSIEKKPKIIETVENNWKIILRVYQHLYSDITDDGDVPEGEEKINFKNLYEMFRNKKSHGLISVQFLGTLGIFFRDGVKESKHALSKLDKNLSMRYFRQGQSV